MAAHYSHTAMDKNSNVNTRVRRKPHKVYKVYNLRPRKINSKASVKLERGDRVKLEGQIRHAPPGLSVSEHRGPAPRSGPDGNGYIEKHTVSNQRANVAPNCPRPNLLVKLGNSARRRVKPSFCALCGDIRYTPPKRKNRVQAKSRSTGPEQPKVRVKTRTTNSINTAPKKLTIWTGMYPMVKLCNLAKCACDVSGQDLCCVLSFGLTTKVIRCFKRDLGTSDPQRRTVHRQTPTGEHIAKAATTNPTASLSPEGGTSEDPTNHSASHLRVRWVSGAAMLNRDVEEDCGAGNDCIATEKWGAKRIRLVRSGRDETASLGPNQDSSSVTDLEWPTGMSMPGGGGGGSVVSSDSQSCLDTGNGSSDASDTHVRTHGSVRQANGQRKDPGGSDASQESSESGLCSLGPDENKIGHDSGSESENVSSCQRVTPHVKRLQQSCARTYITWPFPKSGPPSVMCAHDSNETHPARPVDSSADTVNCVLGSRDRDSSVSAERTTVIPTHGATDTTPSTSHRRSPQREGNNRKKSDVTEGDEEEGGVSEMDEGGDEMDEGGEKKPPSPFSDRPSKATSLFPPVAKTDAPSPTKDLLETDADAAAILSPLKDGAEMDVAPDQAVGLSDPASTPTPVGLSDPASTPTPVGLSDPASTPTAVGLSDPASTPTAVGLSDPASTPTAVGLSDPASTPTAVGLSDPASATALTPVLFSSTPDNSGSEDLLPCQRVIPRVKRPQLSCARTAMSWPFLHSPSVTYVRDGNETLPARPVERSADPAPTPSAVGLSDTDIATASSPRLTTSTPDNIHGLAPSSASPSPNKDVTRGTTSTPSPSSSSPASEHGDEADAASDFNPSGDYSETDSSSSPPPDSHLHSPEDSFHSSKSSLFLTQVERELLQTRSYSGEEEGSEEDVYGESQPSSSGDQGSESGSVGDPSVELLDEFTAYEQDILVVCVQDDPELFGNLPEMSVLGLGPTRGAGVPGGRTTREVIAPSFRSGGPLCATKKSLTTDAIEINGAKTNQRKVIRFNDESSSHPSLKHSNSWPPVDTKDQLDSNNNNRVKEPSERTLDIQTLNSSNSTIPYQMPMDGCDERASRRKNPSGAIRDTTQKSSEYCRYYFKANSTCFYQNCWFLHLPREGDEKLCVDTVLRFSNYQSLSVLQKAVAVFTGYYRSSPPGEHFTPLVLNSLLAALLNAGFVSDIMAVLNVSVAHKILPNPNFLLTLFDYVRQNGLRSPVPELMQLTSKMVEAGLVLSVDYCERVLHSLDFHKASQMDALVPASADLRSPSMKTPKAEPLNVAHAILEVELCTEQEDWARMGAVFLSVGHSHRGVGQLQHFSGCVARALLPETKDRLVLPFATFSETVSQGACEDAVVMAFLGRIGVSLMSRYHQTQQWAKGRKVVEVLSRLKVNYSTLNGLLGNEDGASRCRLVTLAAELFVRSGSVEGALNTLRDNEWFLSSSSWPCVAADVAERSSMLVCLAEKTSHRDTLEVLTNLPGLKDPTDVADASRYAALFNDHLQACVERQTLTVAADTLDFMLSKALSPDPPLLHTLLHKLGKTNNWLRARALFKRALCVGYYPGVWAPPGSLDLTVPCLGETELALALEMFISVNAAAVLNTTDKTACLGITLKRTSDSESEYLSAGSSLLSAAVILRPALTVRYQAVSSSQEQLFTVQTLSAQRWLRLNRSWASELWTHCP